MVEGINYIGFSPSKEGSETLRGFNPKTNKSIPNNFSIATKEEVDSAISKAHSAFFEYRNFSGLKKAAFLTKIAENIIELGDELVDRASAETGLGSGRIEGERGRTCNQLKLFAKILKEGSWVDARIDRAQPERKPKPKQDIRRMLFPIGPVVVFGASNFPLAFSTAGGDTASALAAGCPVIVKSHESHPGTNELVARAIIQAAKETGMPDGVFSSLNGGPEVGGMAVRHPLTKAVGFTGSFTGGKAIFDMAQQREEPIPVYAEMGSINPVFLLNQKLSTSAKDIAEQFADSVQLGAGQFCTNPGLLVAIKSAGLESFKQVLSNKLKESSPACMLNPKIAEAYRKKRAEILSIEGVEALVEPSMEKENLGSSAIASISAKTFMGNRVFGEEVFGPFTLLVECEDRKEMENVAKSLDGQLTITLIGEEEELVEKKNLVHISREKAGRVIFNGVPTGVEVCHSMNHGGPFPATTDSKFTSVGTAAILRFARPVAFQDCPEELLPDELKPDNPLGINRMVDGSLTS